MGVVPQRRRRDDEGEDESSTAGDLDDYSMSEGSAISNGEEEAEIEISDASGDDEDTRESLGNSRASEPTHDEPAAIASASRMDAVSTNTAQADARAISNGIEHENASVADDIHQNEIREIDNENAVPRSASTPQPVQLQGTVAERSRKEHLEYIKQRDTDPAFVPNRGGFFLHDDRSTAQTSSYGRQFVRGRGRGYNTGYATSRGYGQPMTGPTDRPWAHDLHDTVTKSTGSILPKDGPANVQIPTAKPATVTPNRTFSISTVLGNVTVQVYLPGMENRRTFLNVVKKQHTLLPQHRPPLRRDKPVRISIPEGEPRFIFPSTERSFIFIPRAMRPNQQAYPRGRGRGSYHGSRRASILGSAYTPSVAMSRRSSLGGAGSTGVHTPTDGPIPRGSMMSNVIRPIVRMPAGPVNVPLMHQPMMPMVIAPVRSPYPSFSPPPPILQSPTVTLPMYQPRPQKTVSVAEIESPAVKAPDQQHEQPFHQQMPPGVSLTDAQSSQPIQSQQNLPVNASLSHIPEGAIYAQPFQPYPLYSQGAYYGPSFPGGPMVYHPPADPYGMAMGGPVLPQFAPGQGFLPATQPSEGGMQPGTMAHESNGMVYYYDPSQFATEGSNMNQYPMAVGGGMVGVPGPGPYFYPNIPGGMFYPNPQ